MVEKKYVRKDIISFVKSPDTVENKMEIQKLYWDYRKKGLNPKEAWEKAKRGLS